MLSKSTLARELFGTILMSLLFVSTVGSETLMSGILFIVSESSIELLLVELRGVLSCSSESLNLGIDSVDVLEFDAGILGEVSSKEGIVKAGVEPLDVDAGAKIVLVSKVGE